MDVDQMADWEVVEKAADIAEERGVCVGSGFDSEQVCIDVALCMALGYHEAEAKFSYFRILDGGRGRRIAARMADALDLPHPSTAAFAVSRRLYTWNDSATDGLLSDSRYAEALERHPDVLDGARYAAKVMRLEDEGVT